MKREEKSARPDALYGNDLQAFPEKSFSLSGEVCRILDTSGIPLVSWVWLSGCTGQAGLRG